MYFHIRKEEMVFSVIYSTNQQIKLSVIKENIMKRNSAKKNCVFPLTIYQFCHRCNPKRQEMSVIYLFYVTCYRVFKKRLLTGRIRHALLTSNYEQLYSKFYCSPFKDWLHDPRHVSTVEPLEPIINSYHSHANAEHNFIYCQYSITSSVNLYNFSLIAFFITIPST